MQFMDDMFATPLQILKDTLFRNIVVSLTPPYTFTYDTEYDAIHYQPGLPRGQLNLTVMIIEYQR